MEKENVKKKNIKPGVFKEYFRWPLIVLIVSLSLSFTFSFFSELVLNGANLVIAISVIVVFVVISIITDAVGVAITAADEVSFRAMAAKKVKGSKEGIILINNAEKVASIFADIIGDICGILSGAAGAVIAAKLASGIFDEMQVVFIASMVSAVVAGVIIFGKAMFKRVALDSCDKIILALGKILYVVTFGKLSTKKKN